MALLLRTARSPVTVVFSVLASAALLVGLTGCTTAVHSARMVATPGPMMRGDGACRPSVTGAGTVTVVLTDMGGAMMMGGSAGWGATMRLRVLPTTVPAGSITILAVNRGWRTHELVVLPLAASAAPGQRVPGPDGTVDESGALGEASSSCAAGAGEGIAAGSSSWVTLRLPVGRYELVCNLRNHYADGMYGELVVTA